MEHSVLLLSSANVALAQHHSHMTGQTSNNKVLEDQDEEEKEGPDNIFL